MPKKERHPVQTAKLQKYPLLLKHNFEEGDVVRLNRGKGHEMRLLKDIIKRHRKIYRAIDEDNGVFKKTRFHPATRKIIKKEYHLILRNNGVVIGRSPCFGQSMNSIANVCYLVGGSGFGGLSYEYNVCFVTTEYDKSRNLYNKICIIWTLWWGALQALKKGE